jgi:hypothetical protein
MEDKLYVVAYEHEGVLGYLTFTRTYGTKGKYLVYFSPFSKPKDYVNLMKTKAQFDNYISTLQKKEQYLEGSEYSDPSRLTTPVDFSKFKLGEVSISI